MRKSRVKLNRPGYYHCISRTVNREFLLHDREKEHFVELMRRTEAFCGVQVITYAVMSNHFHVLVAENEPVELDDEQLLARLKAYYRNNTTYKEAERFLRQLREEGAHSAAERYRQRFLDRMNNVSEFMKTLKQSFSQWYNKRANRTGPFWSDRFKSVLVQPGSEALRYMAAYIDLNPVRARIVPDAKGYRFSGYGSAVGGVKRSQAGFVRLFQSDSCLAVAMGPRTTAIGWKDVADRYRMLLFGKGVRLSDPAGQTTRSGHSAGEIRLVLKSGGKLTWSDLACCRVRYFSEGVMLGSRAFVEEHESMIRQQLRLKRPRPAKSLREWTEKGLHVFRRYGQQQVCPLD